MKRIILLLTLLLSLPAVAQEWKVEQVPNTRLQSDFIHVSDPDSIINDDDEQIINMACSQVRDSCDIFVVALNKINSDSKTFATKLFNHWGIGDKKKDNGLLLLIVYDDHAIEIETGYGTEGFLPDMVCKHVIDEDIVPHMKESHYSEGIKQGALSLVRKLGGNPDSISTANMSGIMSLASYDNVKYPVIQALDTFGGNVFFIISCIVCVGGIFVWYFNWSELRKKKKKNLAQTNSPLKKVDDGSYFINCITDKDTNAWGGNAWEKKGCLRYIVICLSAIIIMCWASGFADEQVDLGGNSNRTMWLSLLVWLTFICVVHNLVALGKAKKESRDALLPAQSYIAAKDNLLTMVTMVCAPWVGYFFYKIFKKKIQQAKEAEGKCPVCGKKRKKVTGKPLTAAQETEQKLGSICYTWYRCEDGHEMLFKEKGAKYGKYTECKDCHAHARKEVKRETLEEATYSSSGKEVVHYHCHNCGKDSVIERILPKKEYSSSSSSSSGGGWSGGGSSGGSFGGGSSGGGGASGRW